MDTYKYSRYIIVDDMEQKGMGLGMEEKGEKKKSHSGPQNVWQHEMVDRKFREKKNNLKSS